MFKILVLVSTFFAFFVNISKLEAVNSGSKQTPIKDLTIIVPSCDKYSELWEPFFFNLFKSWPSLKKNNSHVEIILIGNKKTYDNRRVVNLSIPNEISWSDNMIAALKKAKTKYIMILLEDYIINTPVDEEKICKIIAAMKRINAAYTEIVEDTYQLKSEPYKNTKILSEELGLLYKPQFSEYRTSLQACIRNREDMLFLLKPKESAWDFELKGSPRSEGFRGPFLLIYKNQPISYLNAVDKGKLRQGVVNYINEQGLNYKPQLLQIDPNLTLNELKEPRFEYQPQPKHLQVGPDQK